MSAVVDEYPTWSAMLQGLRLWPHAKVMIVQWMWHGGDYYTLDEPVDYVPSAGIRLFSGSLAGALKWAQSQVMPEMCDEAQEAAEGSKDFTTNPMTR